MCPLCHEPIGMLAWLPPLRVELITWRREYGDIVPGPGCSLLISPRLKAIVEEHCLTGFEGFDPVTIVRVKHRRRWKVEVPPPKYVRVTVKLGQAAIDQVKSEMEHRNPSTVCASCRTGGFLLRWARVVIEEGTWSGEDIFVARGLPGTFICTERFKQICDEYKILNADFIPAEEYGRDFYPDGYEEDEP